MPNLSGKMLTCGIWFQRLVYVLCILIVMASLAFPVTHVFETPLPEKMPDGSGLKLPDNAEATANAFLQSVFFLTTISFGLAALAVFASNKKTENANWMRPLNAFLLSLLCYFLVRGTTFAYEASLAVVVQLDARVIFLTQLDPLLTNQAKSVLAVAAITFIQTALNLIFQRGWTQDAD